MRARLVNEKFTEKSDPIRDMGIGTDEIVNQFKKELNDEWPTLLGNANDENHFLYYPKEKFIRIDCWPLSALGTHHLIQALKKVYPKYKDVLKITQWPGYQIKGATNRDVIIRIR